MDNFQKEEFNDEILDLLHVAVDQLDMDNREDLILMLKLVECFVEAENMPNKGRKMECVKPCRNERENMGSFSFLMKELGNDELSLYQYIRIDCETFNYILQNIESSIRTQDTLLRKSISPAVKLAATLRYLTTGDSCKSINIHTRLSESFLSAAIPEVCEAIWKCFKNKYLKFPDTVTEWKSIADKFTTKWQFPHCIGALDAKHISFKALEKDEYFFLNSKGTTSIVLLALVDADCRFTYIDVGCNGRTQDALVLLNSQLRDIIAKADKYFPPDEVIGNGRKLPYVIVGDDEFPLKKHLMKPYPYRTKNKKRKIYNIRLERARHVVEHAFEIQSNRFLVLQTKIDLPVEKIDLITKTCCLLHNILCKRDVNYINHQSITAIDEASSKNLRIGRKFDIRPSAQLIRKGFEEYFNQEGKI